jgi:hypothetical protein
VLQGPGRDFRRWVKQSSAGQDRIANKFADRFTLTLRTAPDPVKKRSRRSHIEIFVFLLRHRCVSSVHRRRELRMEWLSYM